jgi:hemoglobin
MSEGKANQSRALTPYQLIGGDDALRRVVERFYALMDEVPEFYGIRRLHPGDLSGSTTKLHYFLSGWLGGPPLYAERIGPPMLRARHLPFSIGKAERDQWLACMRQALEDCGVGPPEFRDWMMQQLFGTADWMRNRPGDMPGDA